MPRCAYARAHCAAMRDATHALNELHYSLTRSAKERYLKSATIIEATTKTGSKWHWSPSATAPASALAQLITGGNHLPVITSSGGLIDRGGAGPPQARLELTRIIQYTGSTWSRHGVGALGPGVKGYLYPHSKLEC
ncbi:hypothetical protein RRG08_052982 [Elysia crispata]|uniref:Uncharacterized protein n=1 Tax=Elysia crispata TaxID=231223 RepID=A0AAE1DHF8_9GAST|nr:hypothetical protein RRG08_052982 [Elysia crispata]